nr:immunoglobulin light chain junction region [Macaca mulatta]MOY00382.1 immunoglobulin light chain junction region [Macaca mulatta]MOY00620.1 immunoglobulin light chain junction region [Macaca mulatta]MOY00745.1 immunoglobulin light chain junction region [Macaca mulatta]MOY02659.1 immunoglobulin light chain junction region [Macaca mulatta]
CQHYNNSPFTF